MSKKVDIKSDGTCVGTTIKIGKTTIKNPMYFRIYGYAAETVEGYGEIPDELVIEVALRPKEGIVQTFSYRAKDGEDALTSAGISSDIAMGEIADIVAELSTAADDAFALAYIDGRGMKTRELPHHIGGKLDINRLRDSLASWKLALAPKRMKEDACKRLIALVEDVKKG
jgi:hypothetical protein